MSPERFDFLLSKVGPLINKQATRLQQPISAAERLALMIRYLAPGDSQQSMSFSYQMGKGTVSKSSKKPVKPFGMHLMKSILDHQLQPKSGRTLPMNTWNCGIFLIVLEHRQ